MKLPILVCPSCQSLYADASVTVPQHPAVAVFSGGYQGMSMRIPIIRCEECSLNTPQNRRCTP